MSNTKLHWPEWLAPANSNLGRHLDAMGQTHYRLKTAADAGFTHRHVPQSMLNMLIDQIRASDVMKRRLDGILAQTAQGQVSLPQSLQRAFICNVGAAHRLCRQFTATNRIAVVKLLDGAIQGIQVGDLLTPLVCIRSCLEQVAHFHNSQKSLHTALSAIPQSAGFDASWKAVIGIQVKLVKIAYGTRIDWMAVAQADPSTPLKMKDTIYKPTANRADLKAETILNAVDAMDKVVPGLRAAYDTLCEFAHPNVGTLLVSARSCEVLPADASGVIWIEKTFGLQPPTELVRKFDTVLEQIFGRLAESLAHYEQLIKNSDAIADEILRQVQSVVRHMVSRRPGLFKLYDPCPCDGSKKLKFCCGRPEN
jgi:hypothetical protein